MRYEVFSKNPGKLPDESEHVSSIAKKLKKYMNTDSFRSEIEKVHKVNGRSQQIQALIAPELEKLGFLSEKKNLFSNGKVPGLKPDLYLKIGRSGILVEVERGKTTANNMDILDVWKCHLCAHADFLFLIVPCERFGQNGKSVKVFDLVSKRVGTFFTPGNYVHVKEVHLFGY